MIIVTVIICLDTSKLKFRFTNIAKSSLLLYDLLDIFLEGSGFSRPTSIVWDDQGGIGRHRVSIKNGKFDKHAFLMEATALNVLCNDQDATGKSRATSGSTKTPDNNDKAIQYR